MAPKLKAVLFDVDDTLFSTTEFASRARREAVDAMRRHGLKVPAEDLLRELNEAIAEFGSNFEHHFDKLLLRLPRPQVRGVNWSLVIAAAIAAYHDAKFTQLGPFDDVVPALTRLAKTDLILGVVTDGLEMKQAEKLIRLKITSYFAPQAIFISDRIGISKPNPKLFLRACEALDVPPGQAIYVGDHPVKDIDGGNAAGLITVLVNRKGRHAGVPGATRPRYTVQEFGELLNIITRDFKVALPS
ncbi:MAG TPA: TIGR02253 family HAD-type hydrolase [Planctomycetota bacterium]|nr:TIGR02253 family HAD-type hydrolase [Planctomycetota bacterium]